MLLTDKAWIVWIRVRGNVASSVMGREQKATLILQEYEHIALLTWNLAENSEGDKHATDNHNIHLPDLPFCCRTSQVQGC